MPELIDPDVAPKTGSWFSEYLEKQASWPMDIDTCVTESIKFFGAKSTLKRIKRANKATLSDVTGGVIEIQPTGRFEAALETEDGSRFISGQCRADELYSDPQVSESGLGVSDVDTLGEQVTPGGLLELLAAEGENISPNHIIEAEITRFDLQQQHRLLPILWSYIHAHRNSSTPGELTAVGSAIRKYIAIMPMEKMETLAALLDPENRSPLPLELELEVAKMIYRNFEVHPPTHANVRSHLASNLMQMAQAYLNPRLLLRDKYSACASLAIEAIVAMRSSLAAEAWDSAMRSPHRWFGEIVNADLNELGSRWSSRNAEAADWLAKLRLSVFSRHRNVESGQKEAIQIPCSATGGK